MTEVEVTLLNVGGINNTPLEYYAGMNKEQSDVMDALLKAAIKKNDTESQGGTVKMIENPDSSYFANDGKEIMRDFQKKLFYKWKELLATTNDNSQPSIEPTELGTKIYNKIKELDGITLDDIYTLKEILDGDLT